MDEDEKGLARKIADEIRDRVVKQDEFYDQLNKSVFLPVLGHELSRQQAKDLVFGIADQISVIVLGGGKVRMGKIGIFKPHVTPPGQRWDPTTKTKFQAQERVKLAFKASKSSKRIFATATDAEKRKDD
jgi:nucleoid DNA-binding protein